MLPYFSGVVLNINWITCIIFPSFTILHLLVLVCHIKCIEVYSCNVRKSNKVQVV